MHLRAAAEHTSPLTILHALIDETLETVSRLDRMTARDGEMRALWEELKQVRPSLSWSNVFFGSRFLRTLSADFC